MAADLLWSARMNPTALRLALTALVTATFATQLVGCAEDDAATTIDCDTATVVGYSELTAFSYCTSCHGANRAEENMRFDTYDDAVANAEEAQATVADGSMPEDTTMPDSAKQELYTWVQCGQPE